MKLYNTMLSPFATRVRLAIYAKGLAVELMPYVEAGLKSPETLSKNPLGRVPALVLDNGDILPESDTIVEYLDDAYPAPPLRPATAEGKARVRLLARIGELYVMKPCEALFAQLDPATRDEAAVTLGFADVATNLGLLDHYLGAWPYAWGETLTTADCALMPVLFFVNGLCTMFGRPPLADGATKSAKYWTFMQTEPVLSRGVAEMAAGLAERMAGGA